MSNAHTFLVLVGAGALVVSCSALPIGGHFETARGVAPNLPLQAVAPTASGPCASLRSSHPKPMEAGRGDRVVLAKEGARTIAYVANEDDAAVHTIDVTAGKELAVTSLEGSPSALVALRDGRIVAALRDRNEVVVLEPDEDLASPLVARCSRTVATEPVGLAATEKTGEAETILVTSGFGHKLTALGESDLAVVRTVDLPRDPRAIFVHEGNAIVSHVTSSELSVVDLSTGASSTVDVLGKQKPAGVAATKREGDPPRPPPIRGGQVFALTSSEGRLFAPMVTVDPGEPKITGAYGSTEVPIKPFVGVVDLTAMRELPIAVPSQTGSSHRACMLPRDAAGRPGGKLFVVCAGIDELLELDGNADNAAHAIRWRARTPSGPLGLAVDDDVAVVLAQFDHEVAIVPLEGNQPMVRVSLSRRSAAVDTAFERGRKIFHQSFDLRVSADGRACASCHPDGRDDGNTWSTPDGPRQTITLAGRISDSGPYGWFGDHPTLDSHLKETMRRLGGAGFGDKSDRDDLTALETYLTKMKTPILSPSEDPEVAKGRALFADPRQGCASCHAEGSTDRTRHDVGSGHHDEKSARFDTPSLALVGANGPYFHDGRYATLGELLEKSNDQMGHVTQLDADQRASLVAYMESIGPRDVDVPQTAFVPGLPSAPLAPDASSKLEQLALRSGPEAHVFARVGFDLASVPIVKTTPAIDWDTKSPDPQGEALPAATLAWKSGCAAVPHHAAASLKLDWRDATMTSALERCVDAPDKDGVHFWTSAALTTIDPAKDHTLHVVEREAFIRIDTHELRVAREVTTDAVPIAGGVAFAYRTECEDCKEGERDELHLIEAAGAGLFETMTLSLDKNHASHTLVSFPPTGTKEWSAISGADVETGSKPGDPRWILVSVDASRTESEDEPRLAIGKTECKTDSFTCQ